jgi:ATP-independent RNA helicase DbpA
MLMNTFENFLLSDKLKAVLTELGYSTPTPIQAQSLPHLLQGRDLIGQSATGSGKTAAYTLPLLERLDRDCPDLQRNRALQALILCPTRELAIQVSGEIRKLGKKHIGLKVLPVTGGVPIGPQIVALEKGIHIVVGTPGRIGDHLRRNTLEIDSIRTLVLDEADRMLEMGFQEEMDFIFTRLPSSRHTMLFSATFPTTIETWSRSIQKDPVRIVIEPETLTRPDIEQQAYMVEPLHGDRVDFNDRLKLMLHLLKERDPASCIVFVNFKADASALERELKRMGVSAGALYGDLEQPERERVMARFRNRSIRILIATDVAARGIDVESVDTVVNFELPLKPEVYVHRIGRTGRAGRSGVSMTLILAKQLEKLTPLEQLTGMKIQSREGPDLRNRSLIELSADLKLDSEMETLFIGAGRKNKIRPGDILGALTGECGIAGEDIGKIEIQDYISFVAISKRVSRRALSGLETGRVKGRRVRVELAR